MAVYALLGGVNTIHAFSLTPHGIYAFCKGVGITIFHLRPLQVLFDPKYKFVLYGKILEPMRCLIPIGGMSGGLMGEWAWPHFPHL